MSANPDHGQMTVEEYLQFDTTSSDTSYEYIDGRLRMLAGGTIDHVAIRDNVYSILRNLLRGRPCRPYTSDARVRLSATRYVYPDVVVTCSEQDRGQVDMIQWPSVAIEVLSPGTEAYDRGAKFLYYRECPTIQEYVLINSRYHLVEVFRREKNNLWLLSTFKLGEDVQLSSLGLSFPVQDIYEDIIFSEDNAHL